MARITATCRPPMPPRLSGVSRLCRKAPTPNLPSADAFWPEKLTSSGWQGGSTLASIGGRYPTASTTVTGTEQGQGLPEHEAHSLNPRCNAPTEPSVALTRGLGVRNCRSLIAISSGSSGSASTSKAGPSRRWRLPQARSGAGSGLPKAGTSPRRRRSTSSSNTPCNYSRPDLPTSTPLERVVCVSMVLYVTLGVFVLLLYRSVRRRQRHTVR